MSDHELSDESVDRVLDGRDVAGEGGAETVGAAAALFRQASGQATADELGAADATITRFVELVLEPEAAPVRRLRAVPIPARAAAVIIAATIWSTGMAAAATGHLPDPVQRVVAHTASHVGLNLPGPSDNQDQKSAAGNEQGATKGENEQGDDTTSTSSTETTTASTGGTTTASTNATTTGATTTASVSSAAATTGATTTSAGGTSTSAADAQVRGVGPDVNGPAGDALCKAYRDAIARGKPKNPDAPPWRNLVEASKASGKSIDELCGVTTSAPVAATVPTTVASTSSTSTTSSTTSTIQAEGTSNGGNNGLGGGNGNGNGNGNGHDNGHSPNP